MLRLALRKVSALSRARDTHRRVSSQLSVKAAGIYARRRFVSVHGYGIGFELIFTTDKIKNGIDLPSISAARTSSNFFFFAFFASVRTVLVHLYPRGFRSSCFRLRYPCVFVARRGEEEEEEEG